MGSDESQGTCENQSLSPLPLSLTVSGIQNTAHVCSTLILQQRKFYSKSISRKQEYMSEKSCIWKESESMRSMWLTW